MKTLKSCEFNLDSGCVELVYSDGTMLTIDTDAVENEYAEDMYQRSELEWLIYNDPLAYADLSGAERRCEGIPEEGDAVPSVGRTVRMRGESFMEATLFSSGNENIKSKHLVYSFSLRRNIDDRWND